MSWQPQVSSQSNGPSSGQIGGSSFSDQRNKESGRGNKSTNDFPLYIVNIPTDLNEEQLEEMFSQAGSVTHSKVLPPKDGRNSCVGFISYNNEEEAEKAISMFNNIQMNHLTLKVDYTRVFKEKRSQMPDNTSSSSGHQNINNNSYSSHNGHAQTSPMQSSQEVQSGNPHSIGRGIHNYDSGSSRISIGRGIHPAPSETKQDVSQPGTSLDPVNRSPGMSQSTARPDETNYMNQASQDVSSFSNAPSQPSTNIHDSYFTDGDSHAQMNGMVSGFGNMQVTNPVEPAVPESLGSTPTFDSSQSFGSGRTFAPNQYQVSSRLPRTQTGSAFTDKTCHKCGEEGHFSRECPNNSGSSGNCHQCGQPGHFSRECPNRSGGGGGGSGCHRCGEQGHFARECPNNSGSGGGVGGGSGCHKCGEQGHYARECPKSSGSGGGGGGCHRCGEQGHFARECPTNSGSGGGGSGCHKCGEQGHFARECPNNSRDGGGGGGGGSNCHQCGQPGHFARECPNRSGYGGGSGCHKCGEQGHFARECPNGDQEGSCPRPPQKIDYVPPALPDDVDLLFKAAVHKGINFDRFDNIPVDVTGVNPPAPINTFDEIILPETLKANLGRAEFTKPTPVQKHGIPIILNGRDIMACAQTGSGKTIAFLLPVMAGMVNSRLPETSYMGGDAPCPVALCIAPTRELALQIFTEALKFSSGTYLRAVVCYGGVSVQHQLHQLERGCHILIATPGRLLDFVGRNKMSLTNIRYLILDEADRMLDMGFENDIRKIVGQFGMPEKSQRQTLMFSATFPDEIQKLAREFLNDYLFLAVGSVGGTNLDIKQEVVDIDGDQKRSKLMEILGNSGTDKTLVFVERKRNADFLANWLSQNNYPATSISGDRSQKEREDALRDFRNGRAPILIATSVAARGLDIPDVKHVVNYDLPQQIEEYVHRIGRTGRIGNQGKATAFFDKRKDEKLARSLVKVLSDALQDVPNWLEGVAERALGTSYGPVGGNFASRDTRRLGGGNSGGGSGCSSYGSGASGNSQRSPSTNISFANQTPNIQSSNIPNGDQEENWD